MHSKTSLYTSQETRGDLKQNTYVDSIRAVFFRIFVSCDSWCIPVVCQEVYRRDVQSCYFSPWHRWGYSQNKPGTKNNDGGEKTPFFFLNTASTDCHSGVIKSGLDGCSVKLSRQTLCELDLPPTKPLSHREHDILNAVVALQDSQKMAEKSSSAVRYLDKSIHGESTTYVSSRRKDLYTHIQQMPWHISLKFVLCSRLSTSCILHLSASITFKFYPERKMSF